MLIDFMWLYFHISILVVVMYREYKRTKSRNLFAIIFCGGFLTLVSGQDWWMLSKFDENEIQGMMHLRQDISLIGVRMANFYTGIAVVCYGFTYWLYEKRQVNSFVGLLEKKNRIRHNAFSYSFLFCWVIIVGIALINSAGGVMEMITNPGLNQSYGVTMFLILISAGKFALMHKIVSNIPIRFVDIVLFLMVFIFILFNARLNIALIILQLVFLVNYCRYQISRSLLLIVPSLMFLVFIIFGLYREFATHAEGIFNQELLTDFFISYAEDLETTLDWFYAANVEGFAGLAGILTFEGNVGGINHDFGLSNFSFITQFIPGSLRNDPGLPFLRFNEEILAIYPYRDGSLIPPGLEMAYGNFGLLGIIAFGAVLGYLTQFFHLAMLNGNSDKLRIGVISVQMLHAIRGPFSNVIFFALSDIIMLLFYRTILTVFSGHQFKTQVNPSQNLFIRVRKYEDRH